MPSGTWKKDTPEERSSSPCEANPKVYSPNLVEVEFSEVRMQDPA